MIRIHSLASSAFAVASVMALSLIPHFAAAAPAWDTYDNARFGYEICYPADLLSPQPEADNGDGRIFTSPTGSSLRVWGTYNANGDSLAVLADQTAADLKGHSGTETYRKLTPSRATVSGQTDGMIFYAVIQTRRDTVYSFILTYPVAQKAIFDSLDGKIQACFHTIEDP